jgi:hypothetical protein
LSAIRAIFWDVGGVLLSNAWDHTERTEALEHFQIDPKEFGDRHQMVVSSFERGKITLDEYLDRTVFYRMRPFSRDAFRDYMFSLSQPFPEVLEFARALSDSGKYFMGTPMDCERSSACLSVPASSAFASRRVTFIGWRWRRRRFPRNSVALSTIVRSIWNAPPSWEWRPLKCGNWSSCEETWRNWA